MNVNNGLENLNIGCICHCKTANDAWEYWYNELASQANNGRLDPSRDGQVVGEFINAITVIDDPTRNIVTSPIRKLPMKYAIGELLWYASGNNKLTEIQKFSKAWDRMSDDGETVNSNYGHKIQHFYGFNQMEYVKGLFEKDRYTRQAVIHIKDARNTLESPTKDMPCTVCLQFFIRPDNEGIDRLHMTTYMRSNDMWMGYPYDIFQFTCMQIQLSMELGVALGTYTHIAGSLHLYERNLVKDKPEV